MRTYKETLADRVLDKAQKCRRFTGLETFDPDSVQLYSIDSEDYILLYNASKGPEAQHHFKGDRLSIQSTKNMYRMFDKAVQTDQKMPRGFKQTIQFAGVHSFVSHTALKYLLSMPISQCALNDMRLMTSSHGPALIALILIYALNALFLINCS
ncbi:hypothetical protein Btru_014109 [Bulinus truncatus]|nr:hypothetical protein Btru_014109 [Bulinus truncatus]